MANTTSNGMAIAALVLGVIAFVLLWVPILNFILAILALVFGIIGLNKAKQLPENKGKGMSIAGIILGGLTLVFGFIVFLGAIAYFGVLSPSNLLPERTTFQAPLPNVDNAVVKSNGNTISIPFRNNAGQPITIPMTGTVTAREGTCSNPTISGEMNGQPIQPSTEIKNGASFILTWDCDDARVKKGDNFKSDLTFEYTGKDTGLTRLASGSVYSQYI